MYYYLDLADANTHLLGKWLKAKTQCAIQGVFYAWQGNLLTNKNNNSGDYSHMKTSKNSVLPER